MSFGILNNADQSQMVLIATACVIMFIFLYWLWNTKDKKVWLSTALVIGGAVGNIIDRILHGAVLDFIDLHYNSWHYPAFNLADSMICIGVLILMFFTKEQ